MKRSLAVALSMLVLAGTSMVWADSTSPTKTVKTVKHHKKRKVALNPQPLPPAQRRRRQPELWPAEGVGGSKPPYASCGVSRF